MVSPPSRNAPCPCGSGRKYKNCCGTPAPRVAVHAEETAAAPPVATLRAALASAAAGVLAVAIYAGTFSGPFVYDDLKYVRDNTFVQDTRNVVSLWNTAYPPDRPDLGLFRPVTATTYMADFARAGSDAGAFHVTNALLHGIATALCVLVVLGFGGGLVGSGLAGVLFALHPVHVEAVAWIVGRAEVLAGIGCFAACLAWLRYARTGSLVAYAAALLCYFLALGAKETAAPLPAALALAAWLGIDRADSAGGLPRPVAGRRARLLPLAGFALSFGAYAALRIHAIGRFSMSEATTAFVGAPTTERLISAVAIIGEYVRLCLLPVNLRVDYGDFRFTAASAGPVLFGVLVLGVLSASIVGAWRRAPRVAFWAGWFLLFVLVFANLVIPIGAVLAERFVYVASLAPCALLGTALGRLLATGRQPSTRLVAATVAVAAMVASGVATTARTRDWLDTVQLFATEIERSPTSEKAHLNLAAELWERGKKGSAPPLLDQAEDVFRRGIAIRKANARTMTADHVRLVYFYGNLLVERGRAADALAQYEQLAAWLRQYPALMPEVGADYFVWYGAALEARGKPDEAIAQYRLGLARRPGWIVPLRNIAQTLMQQRKFSDAIAVYRDALEADPTFSIGYVNLALCLSQVGRPDEARAILDTFRRSVPESATNAYYQGFIAQRLGRSEEAARSYERALTLEPGRVDAQTALASLRRP